MSSNYVVITALKDDRDVIPEDDLDYLCDEHGEPIGFTNGFYFEYRFIKEWLKENNINLSYSVFNSDNVKQIILTDDHMDYRFMYPDRLWGDEFGYLKNLWVTKLPIKDKEIFKQRYPTLSCDLDACFKIDEEFLLNSGYFSDDELNINMYWIELL
jgi:hypothetical protein